MPEAEKISADWVRIITPTDPDQPANAAFEHRAYKVPDLQDMVLRWGKENGLLPEQRGRIINMGTDGPSPMPRRYRISDGGILYQD